MIGYIRTASTVEVIVNGRSYSVHAENKMFHQVLKALSSKNEETILNVLDRALALKDRVKGIEIKGHEVHYDGVVIHGTMVERLLEAISLKLDTQPIINFINKVKANVGNGYIPDEMYDFLEYGKMPIVENGNFLAYKVVRSDYTDHYTGKIYNGIGALVEMNRLDVNDNRYETCSYGLHFCSFEYIKYFATSTSRVIIVEVDPSDVVAIPPDYNNTKARCCRYRVVADITDSGLDWYRNESIPPSYQPEDGIIEEDDDTELDTTMVCTDPKCSNCGSTSLTKKGWTKDGRRRYQCKECGSPSYIKIR